MRDAIARITNSLPDQADAPRIVKADANADAVMRLSLTSATRSPQDLTRIIEDLVQDRLLSAEGVADLQVYGNRQEVFRIDIDMRQLAARGLSLANIRDAVSTVSYDAPAGSLASERQSLVVRTTAAITTPAQFEALVLADGVRLGDVAQVSMGPGLGESILRANGEAGIGLGIIRAAQSNTLNISAAVTRAVEEIRPLLPPDVSLTITSDDATFIQGALDEVITTLALATLIVIAVIYVFLLDLRATFIPAIAMPVALVGTLAAIWIVGFSINILTLLALVLATGMVVDDAIVVLENIVRRRSEGMGARAAAVLGTQQVFFAVVTTTATLAAVFVPLSFLPGQAGGLFREFGFTLAMAVMLSSVVALTLCPVLASRLLRDHKAPAKRGPMQRLGDALAGFYRVTLKAALAAPMVVLVASGLFAGGAFLSAGLIHQELTPPEDRAVALLRISAPQGVSLDHTAAAMREVEDLLQPLMDSGEVTNLFSIAGAGGSTNSGFMVMTLAPWDQRTRSQQEIVGEINGLLRQVIGVRAFAMQPNSLRIRGAGQGLSFAIVGPSYDALATQASELVAAMERNPAFGQVRIDYDTTQPQLFIEVDRARASDLGISIAGLGEALQAVLDGRTVGTVFIGDRSHDIQLISTADPVNDPSDLERVFMRTASGQMVPISTFVTLEERAVAPELGREAQMRSIPISASLTDDLSLGSALSQVEALAAEILPAGSRIVPLADFGRDQFRDLPDLRIRHPHRAAGSFGAVRKFHLGFHRHVHRAAGSGLRPAGAVADRGQPERLFPDRTGLAGRDHGQERHPDRRIRQPVARSGAQCAGRDHGGLGDPPASGDDDHGVDRAGRRAADPVAGGGGRGARGAGLGHRRRAGAGHAGDALPAAGGLSADRRVQHAQGGRGSPPAPRTGSGRGGGRIGPAATGPAAANGRKGMVSDPPRRSPVAPRPNRAARLRARPARHRRQ